MEYSLCVSISYTFLIVGLYESIDMLSICRNIKEDVNAKFVIGAFTYLGSAVSLCIGYAGNNNEFWKNTFLSIGGNLIGYGTVLVFVVRMKQLLQWREEERLKPFFIFSQILFFFFLKNSYFFILCLFFS